MGGILGLKDISIQDNFFELGATSLSLIRIKTVLEEELGLQIPIVDMFANPTIAALAKQMEKIKYGEHDEQEDTKLVGMESGRSGLTRQLQLRKSGETDFS